MLRDAIDKMIPPVVHKPGDKLQDVVGPMENYIRTMHNHPDIQEQGLSEETKQALKAALNSNKE